MPRRNQPRRSTSGGSSRNGGRSPGSGELRAPGVGWSRVESGTDGDWAVRTVPAAQAVKTYRCPGCDHEIRPGVGHVVAWPADDHGGVEDRRHWHSGCWHQRARRGSTRRWS